MQKGTEVEEPCTWLPVQKALSLAKPLAEDYILQEQADCRLQEQVHMQKGTQVGEPYT